MYEQTLLAPKLLTFDYYLQKVPLYLRNSYGFVEHFRIFYWQLRTFAREENKILYLLNIFDADYQAFIESLDNYNEYESDMLDKICSIYAVNRKFKVGAHEYNLTNKELLILLKFKIIRNYCDGSWEQQRNFYLSIGLDVYPITSTTYSLTCAYLLVNGSQVSANIRQLFEDGVFDFKNIGIKTSSSTVITSILHWDTNNEYWDSEGWDA